MAGETVQDISIAKAYRAPLILLLLAYIVAGALAAKSGVLPVGLFWPYLSVWGAITLVSILIWIFVEMLMLARKLADAPLAQIYPRLLKRMPLFALPAVIFPLFLSAYTWAKCSIPFLAGYPWEQSWADADRWIFGQDAWQLAHELMPTAFAYSWSYFYAVVWGGALVYSGSLIFVFEGRRRTATFFTALMASWLAGGIGLAYLLSAAGPVFAGLADPDLAPRFAPLRATLLQLLGYDNIVVTSQRYLAASMNSSFAAKGAGISAMPSMHIATATTILLAGWDRWWRWLAILFLAMTFFGSIYLGYHYAVDAPVAALVAYASWRFAGRIYANSDPARNEADIDYCRTHCSETEIS